MADSRRIPVLLASWLMFCAAPAAHADILHLRDGSRYSGKHIADTQQHILFRVDSPDGKASTVRTFAREKVERIEFGVTAARCDDDGEIEPGEAPDDSADHEQWLREAFELVDRGEPRPAMRVLSRIARTPDRSRLETLSNLCQAARGRPLDEFIAETRVHVAFSSTKDGAIRLAGVTDFESAALGRLLETKIQELLTRTYEGRSIRDWAAKQREYTRATAESPALARDARIAGAMLNARIRHDPRLRENREERAAAVALRDELARLAAQISALRGFGTENAALPSAADFGPPDDGKPMDGRELYDDEEPPAASRPTGERP